MRYVRSGLLAALAVFLSLPCLAQTSAQTVPGHNGAAGQGKSALTQVVITGEKHKETLHEAAADITVVTGEELKTAGVGSLESIPQLSPAVTFKRANTNRDAVLAIRGIGTQSFSPGGKQSVLVVVDGVPMGQPGMITAAFTKIKRVEILAGPQGTIGGTGASAGVINIVTPDPTRTFQGSTSVSWAEGHEYDARLNLSGPINDRMGYVLSALYGDYPGNIYNFYTHSQVNGYRRWGVRGKLVDRLTDSVKLTLEGDYLKENNKCCVDVLGKIITDSQFTDIFLPSLLPSVPGPHALDVNTNFTPETLTTNAGLSATVQWDLARGYTLTSISAFRRWANGQNRPGDFHPTCCNYVAPLDISLDDIGRLDYKQYSEEIRLNSPADQFLQTLVGAFFWHTDERNVFTRHTIYCKSSTLPPDASGYQPCEAGYSTIVNTRGRAHFDSRDDNAALYGQITAHVTKKLRVIAGGRFTHDHIFFDHQYAQLPVAGPGITSTPFTGEGAASAHGFSAKGAIKYDFTPHIMGYILYARGWKGPGFNVFFNMNALQQAPIGPETSSDYEIGLKSELFHQLVLNLSYYYENFIGFQANSFIVTNGVVTTNLTNAGTVRTEGASMNLNWYPGHGLSFYGQFGYDNAFIVKYACTGLTGSSLTSCRTTHDGGMLPFAPRFKSNVGGSWLLPLQGVPFTARLGVTYSYTSLTNFDIDQNPMARQPAYGLLGANLRVGWNHGKCHLTIFGRNLTNRFYTSFITVTGNGTSPGSWARNQIPRDATRFYGVRLSYDFR